jgi:hypothetical protein
MAKHPCLPEKTMTPENLAEWIKENADDDFVHIEKIEIDDDKKSELEHKSSAASRAIDRLEAVKKDFMDIIKEGTPDEEEPFDITIPPTKGMKILKANRAFADKQIENGFEEVNHQLYRIPYPEEGLMVAVDIEGFEWPEFTNEMTTDQVNKFKPMLRKEKKEKPEGKQVNFMDEPALPPGNPSGNPDQALDL